MWKIRINKYIVFLLLGVSVFANESLLSEQKAELLKLKRQKIIQDTDIGEKQWVSPLIFSISVNKNKNTADAESQTKSAGLDWSQDLFRSGGIYYTIEHAQASAKEGMYGVDMEEAMYFKELYILLAQIYRDRLKNKQNELTLKNRDIDLWIIKAKYKAGIADISELNRITIDKDTARTNLIVIKNTLRNEEHALKKLIGDLDYERLSLADINLVTRDEYLQRNLELLQYGAQDKKEDASLKITRSSYLPKLTFKGSLGYSDYESQMGDYSGNSYSYGAVLSMPLDINTFSQIQSSKIQLLQTKIAGLDRKLELKEEYEMRVSTIADYEEKVGVSEEMIKMYEELYNFTEAQVRAGSKSSYDLESLENSLEIQKSEKEIQKYNILIEKISLYFDMRQ
ncbi:TolC family protein [bacterium]|nr:TolC family protein [bacterium]MBU1995409.1 TolC family protein [bacterium]